MPYGEVITRSFLIAWRHRYLWLIALFSGEAGGSASFNYTPPTGKVPDFGSVQEQSTNWVSNHAGLLLGLAVAAVLLAVALFILAAVCEGATVRASAEHDAGQPFGLRQAWAAGLHTMWVMVRFRLVLLAIYLPLLAAVVIWVVVLFIGLIHQDIGLLAGALFAGLFLFVLVFLYGLYLLFLDRFGSRAVILEQRTALAAVARAHRLLVKRFGRSLLLLVLYLAISFAITIAIGGISTVLLLPVFITGYSSSAAFLPILAVTAVILIPVSLVVGGFLGAQASTYWTLAFRRLDLDSVATS